MGLSVNGGCSQLLGAGRQVGTWVEQLSRCLWQTDCSLGTWTGSHPAGADSDLDVSHSVNLHRHRRPSHLESATAPMQICSPVHPLQTSRVEPSYTVSPFFSSLLQPQWMILQFIWSTFDRPLSWGARLWQFNQLMSCTEVDFGSCLNMKGCNFLTFRTIHSHYVHTAYNLRQWVRAWRSVHLLTPALFRSSPHIPDALH